MSVTQRLKKQKWAGDQAFCTGTGPIIPPKARRPGQTQTKMNDTMVGIQEAYIVVIDRLYILKAAKEGQESGSL